MAKLKNLWCLPFTLLGYALAFIVGADWRENYQGQRVFYSTRNLGHTGARGLTLGRVSILLDDNVPHIRNRWYHCAWGRLWSRWGPLLPILYGLQMLYSFAKGYRGLQTMHWATALHIDAKADVDALCFSSNDYMKTLRQLAIGTTHANPDHPDGETLIRMWQRRYAYLDDKDIQRLRNGTRST